MLLCIQKKAWSLGVCTATLNWGKGFSFRKGVVLEIVLLRRKVDMMGKTSQVVLSGIVGSSPYFIPSPCFIPCALSTVRCPQSTLLYRPVLHRPTLACGCTPLKSEERERLISPPPQFLLLSILGRVPYHFCTYFILDKVTSSKKRILLHVRLRIMSSPNP